MNDFDPPIVNVDETPAAESLRDRLRAEREAKREEATDIELIVPGWETVGLRYKAIPQAEFTKLAKRISRGDDNSATLAAYKLLARCFEAVLVRPDLDEDLQVLVDDSNKQFVLSGELAEYLGFEAKTPSEVLKGIFSADKFPLAPITHADALIDWMRGKGDEIDQALLGE